MMPSILLVDDEPDSRTLLAQILERSGFRVTPCDGAERALAEAAARRPDLVLSDVVMPGLDGLGLCRRLRDDRRTAGVPVALMSAMRRSELEQARALDAGADDYLVKPVAPALLAARLRAVLRRRPRLEGPEKPLRAGSLVVDRAGRLASVAGKPIRLTRKEFDLLTTLVEKPGRVLGASYLLETVWGYDPALYQDAHTIEVHMSSLRRKLGARLSRRIATVPGLGYRFDKEAV